MSKSAENDIELKIIDLLLYVVVHLIAHCPHVALLYPRLHTATCRAILPKRLLASKYINSISNSNLWSTLGIDRKLAHDPAISAQRTAVVRILQARNLNRYVSKSTQNHELLVNQELYPSIVCTTIAVSCHLHRDAKHAPETAPLIWRPRTKLYPDDDSGAPFDGRLKPKSSTVRYLIRKTLL